MRWGTQGNAMMVGHILPIRKYLVKEGYSFQVTGSVMVPPEPASVHHDPLTWEPARTKRQCGESNGCFSTQPPPCCSFYKKPSSSPWDHLFYRSSAFHRTNHPRLLTPQRTRDRAPPSAARSSCRDTRPPAPPRQTARHHVQRRPLAWRRCRPWSTSHPRPR